VATGRRRRFLAKTYQLLSRLVPTPERRSVHSAVRTDDPNWMQTLRGRFLVFDGPDGSGKSTQLDRFAQAATDAGVSICRVREPGGTPIGEAVRDVLLDREHGAMTATTEVLLYMASRAQLCAQCIAPALERGELVLADRFISSTLAYQGTAGGVAFDDILAVGKVALHSVEPDLTLVFDVDERTRTARLTGAPVRRRAQRDTGPSLFADRIEDKDAQFHARVREGYLQQAQRWPEQYAVIDARGEPDEVYDAAIKAICERLAQAAR